MPLRWLIAIYSGLLLTTACVAAPPEFDPLTGPEPANRVLRSVDDGDLITLNGGVHPLARPEWDIGPVPPDQRLDEMVLMLRAGPARDAALSKLLAALQDKFSPEYRHFLTPDQFGASFGVSSDDLAAITDWLSRRGLQVNSIPEGRRTVVVSGTAAQVESVFHTSLRRYYVAGEVHFSNETSPEIPAALAPVVEGIVSLHDFRSQPMNVPGLTAPEHTAGGYHYLAPADFAAIYNLLPLYSQGIRGTGQKIAIVARSDVDLNDIRSFRTSFNLPVNDPVTRFPGHDPGKGNSSDQAEATLDVEWAGAIAPNASVILVPAGSTGSTDGAFLSAQYIVNNAVAPILSMSFSECESALGSAGNSFFHSLWQQASAEGITVLVSSGDSGAAGCDVPTASTARAGAAVNGICSPPDATCVGGTEFDDTSFSSLYWSGADQLGHGSALGYIPEIAWNESAGTRIVEPSGFSLGSGLQSTGGGISRVYAKPSWQIGNGVPADGRRDVPDIALAAAAHDGYLVQLNSKTQVFSGTSVAVASFSGMLALIEQSSGAYEGAINPKLYNLARTQSPNPVFHDVMTGSNSVPGLAGYAASPGYDLATGLGSLDGQAILARWNSGTSAPPTLKLTIWPPNIRVFMGSGTAANISIATSDGSSLSTSVLMSIAGLPSGVTARLAPASAEVPGTSVVTLAANRRTQPGTYTVQVTARPADGTAPATASFTLQVLAFRGLRPGVIAPDPRAR